jgi:hypothetical protein
MNTTTVTISKTIDKVIADAEALGLIVSVDEWTHPCIPTSKSWNIRIAHPAHVENHSGFLTVVVHAKTTRTGSVSAQYALNSLYRRHGGTMVKVADLSYWLPQVRKDGDFVAADEA